MQPRRMQSPPSAFAPSMTATLLPNAAATRAALKPALPPPMTMRSYWRIREGAGSPPLAAEHDVDGFQDNGGIKDEREMADVIKVVFELALGVVKVGTVRIVHLRPAGDAGFHEVAEMVAGDLPFIAPHEFAPFRP